MIRLSYIYSIVGALTLSLGIASCGKNETLEENPTVRKIRMPLHFDWSHVDSIPKKMKIVCYPTNGYIHTGGYTVFDVLSTDTAISLPAGCYDIAAYNYDTQYVLISGVPARETLLATTMEYSHHGSVFVKHYLDSLYQGKLILDYPDYMVHAYRPQFYHTNSGETLTLTPDSMVVSVDLTMRGFKNLDLCKEARMTIDNVPGRRYIGYDYKTADPSAVIFDGTIDKQEGIIKAKFFLFGKEPTDLPLQEHRLSLFLGIGQGHVCVPFYVTKSMSGFTTKDNRITIVSPDVEIDLKDFLTINGGIVVDVNEWKDVNQELIY